MDDDGQLGAFADGLDKVVSLGRAHNAGHILDADGGGAHFLHFLGHLCIIFQCMHRAGGVGNGNGGGAAAADGFINGDLDIAQVVESVENADDVDTVLDALLDKELYDIIGIMLVAQQILAAQQHLELGVGHMRLDDAKALPRIFIQKAQTAVKGGAAPALDRIVAGLVHGIQDRLEIPDGHSCCDQRLVGVPQHRFGNVYHTFAHILLPNIKIDKKCHGEGLKHLQSRP